MTIKQYILSIMTKNTEKTAKNEEKALNIVVHNYDLMKNARNPYDKLWDEIDKLIRCADGRKHLRKHKWQSKFFVPYIPSIIDLIIPRLVGKRPSATVSPRKPEFVENSKKMNELINYEQDIMDTDTKFINWVTDSTSFGTGFVKLTWRKETGDNLKRTEETLSKIREQFKITNEDMLYDWPYLENISPYDIFVHPKGTSINDVDAVPALIHRTEETKDELYQNPNYDNDIIKNIPDAGKEIEFYRRERLTTRGLSGSSYSDLQDSTRGYIEVLEYWGGFDIDGDGFDEECVITVANRETVIRIEENPFYHGKKPFIELKYMPDPGFFYGKGVVERLKHLQYELNDIRNHRMDERLMSLMNIIKLKKDTNIPIDTYTVSPGAIWPVREQSDVDVIQPMFNSGAFENEERTVKGDMQMSSGANDAITGSNEVGIASDTARGAQLAAEQSSLRFRVPLLMIDNAIRKFGDMLIALNKQFYDKQDFSLSKPNEDGELESIDITPYDLEGHFQYIVSQGTMSPDSPAAKREKMINLKQLYMNDPSIDQEKIDREVFSAYELDIDDFKKIEDQGGDMTDINDLASLSPEAQAEALSTLSPEEQQIIMQQMGQQTSGVTDGQPQETI